MAIGIGIEVGPSVLRGLVIERSAAGVRLLRAEEVPTDTANPDALTGALAQLRQRLRVAQSVVLGLPSTSAILTTVSPLLVNPRRSGLAVQFELQQHLPFDVSESVWDYRWLGAPATNAVVAAMRRSVFEQRLSCCRRAGLPVGEVAVNAVALLNAWSFAHRGASTAVLLHVVSEGAVEWILASPVAVQVVPVTITAPAAVGEELSASWDAVRTQLATPPASLYLVGPSATIPQLEEIVTTRLGLRAEWVDAAAIASGAKDVKHPERSLIALGLAFQALGLARVPLNLLSAVQTHVRARSVRRSAFILSGVFGAAAAGLGLSGMLEVRERHARVLGALERREQLYQSLRPDARALLQRQEGLEQRTLQLERVAAEAAVLTRLFGQVVEVLPDAIWLTKFEASSNLSPTNTVPTDMAEGLLEGRANSFQDVTQFLDQLKRIAGMRAVKTLSTNVIPASDASTELIAFNVQVHYQPGP